MLILWRQLNALANNKKREHSVYLFSLFTSISYFKKHLNFEKKIRSDIRYPAKSVSGASLVIFSINKCCLRVLIIWKNSSLRIIRAYNRNALCSDTAAEWLAAWDDHQGVQQVRNQGGGCLCSSLRQAVQAVPWHHAGTYRIFHVSPYSY
jgi:hypothetical protein